MKHALINLMFNLKYFFKHKGANVMLIAALLALTANTVRLTDQIHRHRLDTVYNLELNRYLRECWNAETGENLSTDTCVESKFWGLE